VEEEIVSDDELSEEGMVSEQDDVLSEFMGLNDKQLQVYSLVLTLGQVTIGDIAIAIGANPDDVQNIITELEELKLLTPLPGLVPRYQAIPPFDELAKEVSTIGERIERLREELKEQLRNASMTVRNSLFNLAKENSDKIESLSTQQDAHKTKALDAINGVMKTWSEASERLVENSTSTIETTIETAKKKASNEITPVLSFAKSGIASQIDALTSEVQSWASSAKGVSENLKAVLNNQINTFQEEAVEILDNQNDVISGSIISQIETTSSGIHESKIMQSEQLGILKDNAKESLTAISKQISHVLADVQNLIAKSVECVSNDLIEDIEHIRQTFATSVDEDNTADETAITEFDTSFEENLDDYVGKHNQVLEELVTSIESVKSNLTTQSASACSSISQQVNGLATRSQDQMTNAMGSVREIAVNTIQNVFKVTDNSSKSLLGETEAQFSGSKERLQVAMDETSESMKNLSQRSLEMYSGVLEKTKHTIGDELGSIAERTKSRIEEFANTALGNLEALKQSLQNQIIQAVAKGSEQIQALTTSATNEIEQGVETEIQQLGTRLEEQVSEYKSMHNSMTMNIDETISEQVNQHSEMLDVLLNKATVSHEEMLDEVDTIRRHSIGDLDTKLSESKSVTIDSISLMKNETSEIIQNMETLLQDSIETTGNKTQNAISGLRIATDTYVNSLQENRSSLIAGLRTRRNQLRSTLAESVETSASEGQARLHDESAAVLQMLTEKSDEMKTSAQTDIASIEEKGTALFTSTSEKIEQSFDSVDSTVRTTLEEVKNNLAHSMNELKGGLTEHSASLLSRIDSSVGEIESSIDTKTEQQHASIDSVSEDTKSGIDSLSIKLTSTIENAADTVKTESIKVVTTAMKSTKKSTEGLKAELEENLTAGYNGLNSDTTDVQNALNQLLDKLQESPMLGLTEETLDEAFAAPAEGAGADAAAVLSKVWERVGATDFPGAKDFWTVSTRSAVLSHISDMVQRAKSKITLILAYPKEIPTEMLVDIKSTVGVELVVTEGGLLADKARPLVGRGNVRVRTRTETDVYACVRDAEEVLLAPVTKDDRDVIGIATEDPGFVKFTMGVIGPIMQAKAKLLRPGDI
ncbi:MAG: hypothetical protein PVG65_03050, partial [Candidatus Thorarchaeota archaeon]